MHFDHTRDRSPPQQKNWLANGVLAGSGRDSTTSTLNHYPDNKRWLLLLKPQRFFVVLSEIFTHSQKVVCSQKLQNYSKYPYKSDNILRMTYIYYGSNFDQI